MKIKDNNYELKVGMQSLRLLNEEHGIDLMNNPPSYEKMGRVIHSVIKAYYLPEITLEEVEAALDDDLTGMREIIQAVSVFFDKLEDAAAEAKNSEAAS